MPKVSAPMSHSGNSADTYARIVIKINVVSITELMETSGNSCRKACCNLSEPQQLLSGTLVSVTTFGRSFDKIKGNTTTFKKM